MPIELFELIVRAEIIPDIAPAQKSGAMNAGGTVSPKDKEELIQDCARQVIAMLDKKTDR